MYMVPLEADPRLKVKITPDEFGAIFGNIKPIAMLHTNLLKQLESMPANGVSAVFLHNLKEIEDTYSSYLSKLGNAMFSLKACKQRAKAINQFIVEREEILGEGNELSTLLTLPVQRILHYAGVIGQLIASNSSDPALPGALDALKTLVQKLNRCSASSDSLGKILNVRRRLQNYDGNLIDPRRRLLREGPVQVQLPAPPLAPGSTDSKAKKGMTATYLFLFNDLLLFTKAPNLSRTTYKVIGQLEMHRAQLADEESATSFNLEEKQRGKHSKVKVYPVQCDSPEEKATWMTSLLNSIEEMKGTRKIYGIPLDQLMKTSRENGRDVPILLEKATEWIILNALSEEGIFRKAGKLDSIEDYKDHFNQGKEIAFAPNEDPHVVAGVMNHFLMELPDPILTSDMYSLYIDSVKSAPSAIVPRLKELISQLPPYNRYVLQHLMSFFQLVIAQESNNKMSPVNLAIVFGPTLLGSGKAESIFQDFTSNQKVIEAMILNYNTLFQETEEERKQRRTRFLQAQETQKNKIETQQRRATERMGALQISTSGDNAVSPARPPANANYVRKALGDRGSGSLLPPLPQTPGNEASASNIRSSTSSRKPLPPPPTSGGTPSSASDSGHLSPSASPVLPRPGSGKMRALPVPSTIGLSAGSRSSLDGSGGSLVSATSGAVECDLQQLISNIRSLPSGSVVKQGWLTKKGGQRRNWKTRWFVLRPNEFSYYNNKKDAKPKGTIVLSGVSVKASSHTAFCFAVTTTERTYLMAAKDTAEQEEWMNAINACLKSMNP